MPHPPAGETVPRPGDDVSARGADGAPPDGGGHDAPRGGAGTTGSPTPRPVVWYLAALCLALTVPLLCVAAWTTLHYAAAERAGLERAARDALGGVAAALDRELARHVAMLQALATSPALESDDLGRFHAQASELVGEGGANIVLDGLDGRQIVNTRLPWGTPPAAFAPQAVHREVLRTGRPQVSDLVVGPGTGRLLVIVSVPVRREGRIERSLNLALPVGALGEVLARAAPSGPYAIGVADRGGTILARSPDAGAAAGKPMPGFADMREEAGTWTGTNTAGVPVLRVYRRLPSTGWIVAAGVPQAALDAPLRRSLLALAGAALALALFGGGAAFVCARQIARSARGVAGLARDLGAGRPVRVEPLPVKEAVVIGEAMAAASRALRERDAALETGRDDLRRANAELEARVEARTRELAESEARHRLLAETTSDVIVLGHADGRRSYVSPAIRPLLGYTPAEALARGLREIVHPDDLGRVFAATLDLCPERPRASVTHRALHRDGHWVWVEAAYRLGDDGRGTIVASLRDVTARQRAAEDLQSAKAEAERARAQAEAAAAAKSDFLATMSHEIRTPLNGIIGFAGLILDRADLAPDLRRQVGLVLTAATALRTVVDDVLDLSKIEAGGIALDPRPFATESLVDNTASIVRGTAEAKGLAFAVEIAPGVPAWLVGDEHRLRQVLLNFLNNAIKFTRRGRVVLRVSREADGAEADGAEADGTETDGTETDGARGVRLRFAVSDTGIGIAREKQDRLFQRFSQMDASISREFGGTGLGLAICKHLAGLMGGTVGVESRPGVGSTFWCTVALARGAPAPPGGTCGAPRPPARRREGRILVVDDAPMNQEVARAVLEGAGFAVDVAADGPAAVEAARTGGYHLVLMDVQMPGMTGVEATRRIRALPDPAGSVPVVALTANVLPDQVAGYKRAGMDDHVGKPIERAELFAAVGRWMRAPAPVAGAAGPADGAGPPAPSFDDAEYRRLAGLLGERRAAGFLGAFREALRDGFADEPASPEAVERLKAEAHAAVSQAAMMGFARLSGACRRLEAACGGGGDAAAALAEVRALRGEAVARADALLADALSAEAAEAAMPPGAGAAS